MKRQIWIVGLLFGLGFGLTACGSSQDIADMSNAEKSIHSNEADAERASEADRKGADDGQSHRDDAAAVADDAETADLTAVGTGYHASLPKAEPTLEIGSQQRMYRADLPEQDDTPALEAKPVGEYRQDYHSQD